MERETNTDAQGNFLFEKVTSGQHVLSFTEYKMVGFSTHGRRCEYGSRCAATVLSVEEGQELNNVLLDVSKSVCTAEVEIVDSKEQPVNNVSLSFDVEMPQGPERAYIYSTIFNVKHSNPQGPYHFDGLPP